MPGFDDIQQDLADRRAAGLYRVRRVINSAQGRELTVDGRQLINFCSNDYLGLAGDARVNEAFKAAVERWGTGSGASHLVTGHTGIHEELEEALAIFTGRPRCLVFSSGFAANTGTIAALTSRGDAIFQDRLNHASLLDGARLSGARMHRYHHRDVEDLNRRLQKHRSDRRNLIVSDGTFSMDGTVCDVSALVREARSANAWLMIDEAHSLGVSGRNGRGLVDPDQYSTDDVQVLVGTLGKAFGTQGGFVAGTDDLIESLVQNARAYIYSTAMPSAVAAATLRSLRIAQDENWRREQLDHLIKRFRSGAAELGVQLMDSQTPIQPIVLGDTETAVELSQGLEQLGLLVSAIRPPTVPRGTSRLRVTLSALHTDDDVDQLLGGLEKLAT